MTQDLEPTSDPEITPPAPGDPEPRPEQPESETRPEPEQPRTSRLARRSAALRDRRRWWLIAGAVAGVALVALLGVVGYRLFASQVDAARKLDRAAVLVEEADAIVVQVDGVVRSNVTTGLADSAQAASEQVPEGVALLEKAQGLIAVAEEKGTAGDRERAQLLSEATDARLDMLGQAPAILSLNIQAAEALGYARSGWDLVLEADRLSDSAVAAYNKLTKAGVRESSRLNKEAAAKLAEAREQFVKAEAAFPQVDFEAYLDYIDTRIELNELSQQSDEAWLKKKTSKANSIIAQYNALDQKSVAQAQALPPSPEQAIAETYETEAQAATNAYYDARDAATAADKALRQSSE